MPLGTYVPTFARLQVLSGMLDFPAIVYCFLLGPIMRSRNYATSEFQNVW
jgi:hypothetical protein